MKLLIILNLNIAPKSFWLQAENKLVAVTLQKNKLLIAKCNELYFFGLTFNKPSKVNILIIEKPVN